MQTMSDKHQKSEWKETYYPKRKYDIHEAFEAMVEEIHPCDDCTISVQEKDVAYLVTAEFRE